MFPFPSPAAGAGPHTRLLAPGAWPSGVTHLDAFYASSWPAPTTVVSDLFTSVKCRFEYMIIEHYEHCKFITIYLRVFHHTKCMDASINPILAITVVVIPASVTLHEGFEHAVLDAISVVGLIRPPVGVLSYRVAFVPTKFSCKQKWKAIDSSKQDYYISLKISYVMCWAENIFFHF